MYFESVKKRTGDIIPFDQSRITAAILKAMKVSEEGDEGDAENVSSKVVKELSKIYPAGTILTIEQIQDVVERQLILLDYPKTAKNYILYRRERESVRKARKKIPKEVKKIVDENKKYFRNSLGEFIYYRSYSRWIEEEGRRETWIESVDRYLNFMKKNIGKAIDEEEYTEIRESILKQEAMPSMRLLWSAGKAAEKTNVTGYNCSFIAPTKIEDFAEIMYLSMCGAGVGFSVENQTVQMLPQIKKQSGKMLTPHVVEDSKEGWGDALTAGLRAWYSGKDIKFDFSKVRPQGARLMTMGGKSSGPGPLKALLEFSRKKILKKQDRRLDPIDVHDIICKIGEVVVMGGVRRTALISLSDLDDQAMRKAKEGQFYLFEPQRSMANNSAVYNKKPTSSDFLDEWIALAKSGTGERGIFNRGSLKNQMPKRRWEKIGDHLETTGTNPCVTGDTLVYVADGRGNVSIKQLAEEGRDVPVFCYDDKGKLAVRNMRNPRLTGEGQEVYRITLDDGSVIKTTANHKFLLKSGRYEETKNLRKGDSLSVITKFETSIKDILGKANQRAGDYWWINSGQRSNVGEHRLIASFHHNSEIPKGYIVHHRDHNSQNNFPNNLEILSKKDHDALHGDLIRGENNPMRRTCKKWGERRWKEYKNRISESISGPANGRFSGITNEALKGHALALTRELDRRFSAKDWAEYASCYQLPQHFSKWRRDHLGGIMGLAKWASAELGIEHLDVDPRVVKSYKKYTAEGYNCEIKNGRLVILKLCESCGKNFKTTISRREYGVCSISCGLRIKWEDLDFRNKTLRKINERHVSRKERIRNEQTMIYSDLRFKMGRDPLKKEWAQACREQGSSTEISRESSPFKSFDELREAASRYNHKVVSVELVGYENVYNGTVDEFHNFFVGGFASETKEGKRKITYLNNLNCGEIILRSKQFCNLTEVVARADDTEETLLKKMKIATILGTYQSTLTNFPYLSKEWRKNCEEERLLGVSITGQWDCEAVRNPETLRKMKELAIEINKEYAKKMGINASASITCVKPSGTVSQLVDSASGLHQRHAPYYIRRIRIAATDALFKMLRDQKFPYYPEVGQSGDDVSTYVLEFPVKAPEGSIFRNDLSAMDQLEHWKMVKENYIEHNPSVTISVGNEEWIAVADWLYENWDIIGGLSFLPRNDHVYEMAPYEEISEEQYNSMVKKMPKVDFSEILLYEKKDETQGAKEFACVSGVCEA